MNKLYLRKVAKTDLGIMASERLDLSIEQEKGSNKHRHCSFSFSSQMAGVPNIEGHISFLASSEHEPTGISHSSGKLTMESMSNFTALNALLNRLETLCASGLTDEQIFNDDRVLQILKNNDFQSYESFKVRS